MPTVLQPPAPSRSTPPPARPARLIPRSPKVRYPASSPARPARPPWPVSRFGATAEGGQVVLHWETAFELGTAGFHVERLEPILGDYERVNDKLLPALITSPRGGSYTYVDPAPGRRTIAIVWWSRRSGAAPEFTALSSVTPVEPRRPLAKVASAQEHPGDRVRPRHADPARGLPGCCPRDRDRWNRECRAERDAGAPRWTGGRPGREPSADSAADPGPSDPLSMPAPPNWPGFWAHRGGAWMDASRSWS